MAHLIHLIYCSTAKHSFSRSELSVLLINARKRNVQLGVTGILLYSDGNFFQVLEGEIETVDHLFKKISQDDRHKNVTIIIREAIPERAFGDWTMAYSDISPEEADTIIGASDFFGKGASFANLGQGRAKKLLNAFRQGSWRSRLSDTATPTSTAYSIKPPNFSTPGTFPETTLPGRAKDRWYTFAYQPIVNVQANFIFSYEALIRGKHNEPASFVLQKINPPEMHLFDEQCRVAAIQMAAQCGLTTRLNLNFLPLSIESSPTSLSSVLQTAEQFNLHPSQIVIEILEKEIIHNFDRFLMIVNEYRKTGIIFAIDDFGSGYAGLNLLADFQPDIIKLDMHLIRQIHSKGPRQAIVCGIIRTCIDLGIDIIAEGVETRNEYEWLKNAGINYFQGMLFAKPEFEKLAEAFQLPA
jgi:EAL domain-containing protein (putative c-di-GMP-specific phosphodiesterase class I)